MLHLSLPRGWKATVSLMVIDTFKSVSLWLTEGRIHKRVRSGFRDVLN